MDVTQTPLPGIGVRYDFTTEGGRRVGLVVHRDGAVDLVVYALDDHDLASELVTLQQPERTALVELLALPPGESDPDARTHHRTWRLTEDET